MTIGAIAGLAGTIVMDVFGMGLFVALGSPASLSFSIIGDAAAAFLAWLGHSLRLASAWKGLGLGILYVEIMSQPLLAAAAIVLRMTAAEAAQWFGLSFVMHLVYGGVLGLVIARGLRPPAARPFRP
jgi:hypothetical protein